MESLNVAEMIEAKQILEVYFKQIEAGSPPQFVDLIKRYNTLIDYNPVCFEVFCLAFLIGDLYPVEFGHAINSKLAGMGLPSPVKFPT